MEFTVRIELGNAEMQTGLHIAEALAGKVIPAIIHIDDPQSTLRPITDANGNIVGEWGFRE